MNDATGLTKDVGWELGVRRTVTAPVDEVWEYFVVDGLTTWLGNTTLPMHKGDAYLTADGVKGEIRSRTEQLRLRLTWQPEDWDFHHERLASADERQRMLARWTAVLDEIVDDLS
jgi:uncharacterized protein YndB with AHSA1/START domain